MHSPSVPPVWFIPLVLRFEMDTYYWSGISFLARKNVGQVNLWRYLNAAFFEAANALSDGFP